MTETQTENTKLKAQDLRIGNLINRRYEYKNVPHLNKTKIEIVCEVSKEFLNQSCGFPEPIPLTEEILLKCGFVKDELHDCFVIWQSESDVAIEFFVNEIHLVGYSSAEPIENCKYLHQLQNLYFALTGTELNIENLL
jgi:hypothetical protein